MSKQNLNYIFEPKSIAIVGVSKEQTIVSSPGQRYLKAVLDYGFKGKVYPVSAKGGEIWGLKMYTHIRDLPEPVDYVICCTPASGALQLIKDCAKNGVKVVQFFTAGFSEVGTEKGKQCKMSFAH